MTPAELFLLDIIAVCEKHKLVLTVSNYDHLQVWPLDNAMDDLEDIRIAEDRT